MGRGAALQSIMGPSWSSPCGARGRPQPNPERAGLRLSCSPGCCEMVGSLVLRPRGDVVRLLLSEVGSEQLLDETERPELLAETQPLQVKSAEAAAGGHVWARGWVPLPSAPSGRGGEPRLALPSPPRTRPPRAWPLSFQRGCPRGGDGTGPTAQEEEDEPRRRVFTRWWVVLVSGPGRALPPTRLASLSILQMRKDGGEEARASGLGWRSADSAAPGWGGSGPPSPVPCAWRRVRPSPCPAARSRPGMHGWSLPGLAADGPSWTAANALGICHVHSFGIPPHS